MARATIKSIAKKTGYSVGTVSNALRDAPSVKQETRDEIHKAATALGYRVNLDGLKLRTNKSYRIAVLVSVSEDAAEEWEGVEFTRILAGISKAVQGSRYQLSVFSTSGDDTELKTLRSIVQEGLADGVIFSGTRVNDPRIAYLQAEAFPFVTYGMSSSDLPHAYVDLDSETAAYEATARLIGLGHRRIALINPPDDLVYALQRRLGYADALSKGALGFDPTLIATGPTTAETGQTAFAALMQLPKPPSAIICANEAMTLGALSAAAKQGVRVGQDVVVISNDDLKLSQYFVPPPSTYYLPIGETSRLLGEFMLQALAGADPSTIQKKIRAQLIERQPDTPPPEPAI
ncbi:MULTISPECIES: LacI family DNA-binding transcriptional regulator [unclassified Ruegeria]|uniref:LacI family DNA-binding transcriptional regulator n=1 Tax=unclassified Ruegeria TaxID=2625375 RepID=UPI0014920952|nr:MULTISPECIES: LacI family transcriptional regulator [unclassified Ruegeria]NOD47471.1 substrate-binding domain-containing protein [Ruegeria sp. HKCCD5849]NOD53136.1 substrate-binding domain-containing protein [Ruegeria sp. HKCCD5851]NOD66329.1 substrate-binding domain-containing protein [Ruegeria sp. HKCCD7303]